MSQDYYSEQGQQHQSYGSQGYSQEEMSRFEHGNSSNANNRQQVNFSARQSTIDQQNLLLHQNQAQYTSTSHYGHYNAYEMPLPPHQSPQFYGQQLPPVIPEQIYQQYNQGAYQQRYSLPQYTLEIAQQQPNFQQSPSRFVDKRQQSFDNPASKTQFYQSHIHQFDPQEHHSRYVTDQPQKPQVNQVQQKVIKQELNYPVHQLSSDQTHRSPTIPIYRESTVQVKQQPIKMEEQILAIQPSKLQSHPPTMQQLNESPTTYTLQPSRNDMDVRQPYLGHAEQQNRSVQTDLSSSDQSMAQHYNPQSMSSITPCDLKNLQHIPRFQTYTTQPVKQPDPPQPRILQESTQNRSILLQQHIMKQQQSQSQVKQPPPPIDHTSKYPGLLMTLADEYIEAAGKLPTRSEQYYTLCSTAIGCMDLTLRNFKLEPLREAQLRLKYAQILHDETNNLEEVEMVLTKGIDLCDNMKFTDLKYAMKSLLVKVLAQSNSRAAMQDLKKIIEDVVTYRHTAWEYALRFQAASLAVNPNGQQSFNEAFNQLSRIQHIARTHNDHGVYAFASILQAQLHLQHATPDSIEQSKRAMSQARSLQLSPDVENHPQMQVLMDMIDLIWSMMECDEKEISRKRIILKEGFYDKGIEHPNWSHDDSIWLRVNSSSLRGVQVQDGGLIHQVDGKYYLALSWMGKKEIETLSFLLVGLALAPQNCQLKGKAINFLQGGLPLLEDELLGADKLFSGKEDATVKRCHVMAMHMKAETAFLLCAQGKWKDVKDCITFIDKHMDQLKPNVPQDLVVMLAYLKGCYWQGTGDLQRALELYMTEPLLLRRKDPETSTITKLSSREQAVQSFQILAAMNAMLMVGAPDHPLHSQLKTIMNTIASNISANSPQLHFAAHSIVLSALPNITTLQLKAVLSDALKSARMIHNNQIISLTLTLMQDKFFRGGVQNAQAISCAKAAAHQVRQKWGQPLWMVIAESMQLESMRLQQDPLDPKEYELKRQDVIQKQIDLQQAWRNVPEMVRNSMTG